MKIKLGVVIDGETYYPPSWMYLLAFAIRGHEWAIKEIQENEERFKENIRIWNKEQYKLELEQKIKINIKDLLEHIEQLDSNLRKYYEQRTKR